MKEVTMITPGIRGLKKNPNLKKTQPNPLQVFFKLTKFEVADSKSSKVRYVHTISQPDGTRKKLFLKWMCSKYQLW